MEISAYTHVGIRVAQRDRSVDFYRKLGFEPTYEAEGGRVVILKNVHGIEINLIVNATHGGEKNILMDVPEKYPGITHSSFLAGSLDETLAGLEAAGIPISEGPVQLGSVKAVFIRDPDRNVIQLDHER